MGAVTELIGVSWSVPGRPPAGFDKPGAILIHAAESRSEEIKLIDLFIVV